MSKIAITPNASGTGTFTIASPNSDTDRTLTLPDAAGAVVIDEAGGGSVKIDSNGNVGIGTSSPQYKVNISNADASTGFTANPLLVLTNTQYTAGTGATLGFGFTSNSIGAAITGRSVQSSAGGHLTFETRDNFGTVGERMRIDSAGRVTMPYQPAFHAYGNPVGSTVFNENDTVPFPNARYNIGNHYNTSTSTFTAPVTGIYHIWFVAFNNSSAAQRVQLRVNGSAIFGQGSATSYVDFHQSVTAYMVAGDSIKVTVTYNNTTIYQSSQHTEFGGCLLG